MVIEVLRGTQQSGTENSGNCEDKKRDSRHFPFHIFLLIVSAGVTLRIHRVILLKPLYEYYAQALAHLGRAVENYPSV